ncbi:two-component system response regulator [Pseudovibrio japonicus]|uniref:Two-component system response regulator n=1 Tax=Pseudovibrio japonicus TaxID=366534 RepID=A0ABQ3EHK7_9HYPH|nr:ANTAR domain-containing protein [Pseudovibrio japonicus]GHB35197.1 two-component system response regulator [Pseudovibrio japonicus]
MVTDDLEILLVDANEASTAVIEAGLHAAGLNRVTVASDLNGIGRVIERARPDVIVIDLGNPQRDTLESVFQLTRSAKRPIAMFVDQSDQSDIEAAIDAGVSAYVVNGLRQDRVKPLLDLAIHRFNATTKLERELEDARNELTDRKIIDRAKGILIETQSIPEAKAYALLRQTAMNQNQTIAEVAKSIITTSSLLNLEKVRS